jgi:thymidine phosphorylase
MDRPLGRACGNALEVEESIAALLGEGPLDLMEVTYALGVEMLLLGGAAETRLEARARLERAIADGSAADRFRRIVEAQGGNPHVLDDPAVLPQAGQVEVWRAPRAGVVTRVEPRAVGRGIIALGGGRTKVEDTVDPSVGFVITARPGDRVAAGEPLASIFARDPVGIAAGSEALRQAIAIGDALEVPPLPLVSHRVSAAGVEVLAD